MGRSQGQIQMPCFWRVGRAGSVGEKWPRSSRPVWETVYRSVAWVVEYGLAHRRMESNPAGFAGVTAIGVDEVQFRKSIPAGIAGHRSRTVVYQIDAHCRRLLWVGPERTAETLLRFFKALGREQTAALRFVCSDMGRPYLKVIAKKVPHAMRSLLGSTHILDRFHLVARLNQALDQVRATEAKRLAQEGYEPVLKRSRWCFLKKPKNLTATQQTKLSDLLQYDLKTVRGYLSIPAGIALEESFQCFWAYTSPQKGGPLPDRLVGPGDAQPSGTDQESRAEYP